MRSLFMSLVVLICVVSLFAQTNPPEPPPPMNFLDLRYEFSSKTSDQTYANAIWIHLLDQGKYLFTASLLNVPPANNRLEPSAGVGYNIAKVGDYYGYAILSVAHDLKSQEQHLQPAFFFVDQEGNCQGQLFAFKYLPLSRGMERIYHTIVDPAEILYKLFGPVFAGFSLYHLEPKEVDDLNPRVTKYGLKATVLFNNCQLSLSGRRSRTTFPGFSINDTEFLLGAFVSF